MPSGGSNNVNINNPNNPNYKPGSKLGKNFLKPRHNGSPPTQGPPPSSYYTKKLNNTSKSSLSSSNPSLNSSTPSLYAFKNGSNTSLQNTHFYTSSPNLSTSVSNNSLNTIQQSKSIHDYGSLFSKVNIHIAVNLKILIN